MENGQGRKRKVTGTSFRKSKLLRHGKAGEGDSGGERRTRAIHLKQRRIKEGSSGGKMKRVLEASEKTAKMRETPEKREKSLPTLLAVRGGLLTGK